MTAFIRSSTGCSSRWTSSARSTRLAFAPGRRRRSGVSTLVVAASSSLASGAADRSDLMPTARSGRRCSCAAAPTSSDRSACCSRFADLLKFFLKETIIPAGANKGVFLLAPISPHDARLVAWAVIPFGDGWVIANINVGILYLFAISSLGVYGIIMAGWASNSKYAFLGGAALGGADGVLRGLDRLRHHHRAAVRRLAQPDRHRARAGHALRLLGWYWLPLLPMFVIFFISALAETNRPPFDLPEARVGTGRRLSGRIFGSMPLRSSSRRIRQHDPDVRDDDDAVPRRLAVADRRSRPSPGSPASSGSLLKTCCVVLLFCVVEGLRASLSLRPADAAGLEGVPADLAVLVVLIAGVLVADRLAECASTAMTELMSHGAQARPGRALAVPASSFGAFALTLRYMFKPKATVNYPYEKGPLSPALPRRACAAPLSQRRGTLHRLQAVRGDLPGAGHHHRGRAAPHDGSRRTTRYDIDMTKCIYCGLARRPARSTPSSRDRISNSPTETREELFYDKDKLLANGDRWEREIARNLALDAPYR